MNILALTKYSHKGPSSRYRFYQYLPDLQKNGCVVDVQYFFDQHYLDQLFSGGSVGRFYLAKRFLLRMGTCLLSKRYDLVWIEGELLPFLPGWFEKLFHKCMPKKRLYDFDDAVWFRYADKPKLEGKYRQILEDAALVMVGNDYLAEYVRQINKATAYLPTVISGAKYQRFQANLKGRVIGWIGSPTTVFFLEKLKPVFEQLAQDIEFELHVVGARLEWDKVAVKSFAWSEETELELISHFDIGIMPLDDSEFAKGKCGLKLIQYMATGVPAIASPVGVNRHLIEASGGGLLAGDLEQWIGALRSLLTKKPQRMELAQKGRAWALEHLTVEAQYPRLKRWFEEVLQRR